MQNQRTGPVSAPQASVDDGLWYGRELNRHAARATAAHDRYDALERRLEQLVEKWRSKCGPESSLTFRGLVGECADELAQLLEDAP